MQEPKGLEDLNEDTIKKGKKPAFNFEPEFDPGEYDEKIHDASDKERQEDLERRND